MATETVTLAELNELILAYPDIARKVINEHPELALPMLEEGRKAQLAEAAHEDSPAGYCAWYELKYGFSPPKHVIREIEKIFADHAEGIGTVVFAWRGSWKTVSIDVTFVEWRIGLEPHKTNLIVGANDDSAEKVTKAISATIEFHPEWRRAFPNVVPDTGRWSVEGFWVIDTSISREEWAKKIGGAIDPTFVGGGYKSTRLNGKHPSGVLCIDDIHDINNSMSDKERKAVVMALTTVILKTAIRENDKLVTWIIDVGTPWAADDGHHVMKDSGSYGYIACPAMRRAADGEGIYIDGRNPKHDIVYEDIVGWWILEWPERFGVNSIIAERSLGKSQFWQMIMLDLNQASTGSLKYYSYPHEQIQNDWLVQTGIDPTNIETPSGARSHRSFFAASNTAKLPAGGAVVVDGILEQCSQLQAENHIVSLMTIYPNWLGGYVENVGGGAGFIQTLNRNPQLSGKIFASGLKGISDAKIRSKKSRVENDMAQYFENGIVRISDADTPFLNALRRAFDKFFDLDETDYAFDATDATYHAIRNMPEVLMTKMIAERALFGKKKNQSHPMSGIRDFKWS